MRTSTSTDGQDSAIADQCQKPSSHARRKTHAKDSMAIEVHAYDILIQRARLLSCPARLDVLQCVATSGMHPGDIARTLDLTPSTISHHLSVLEHAGLVRHTQQGR